MTKLINQEALPKTEQEVISRLHRKPEQVKLNLVARGDKDTRHWITLTYAFEDKLTRLGQWLDDIARDIYESGGVVTQIVISSTSALRPANASPDDYDPTGTWRAMFVDVSIRTRLRAEAANWKQAVQDIINSHKL